MTWFDFFVHLLNLLVPAFGVATLGATCAKLLWHHRLSGRPWYVLAGWTFAVGVMVTLAGLAVFGQDGRMATYVALCVACALTLWGLGFARC